MLERKVHSNDDITFFSALTFAKLSCDNLLQHKRFFGMQHIITQELGKRYYMGKNVLSSIDIGSTVVIYVVLWPCC